MSNHVSEDAWPEGYDPDAPEEKSKSQVKREMLALQALGTELVELPATQLDKLPLSIKLRDAIDLCQRISSHGARTRQLQFIGRIMRDEEAEPLQRALDEIRYSARKQAQQFHQIERWRDRLIAEGDNALNDLLAEFPHAERQPLRTLIRQAQKELKEQKPPTASREIFRVLRDLNQA